jgi:hypothetical protein
MKKIRRSNECLPLYAIFQLISPFIAPYPRMGRDPHHVNFIPIVLQPSTGLLDFIYERVSPWSNQVCRALRELTIRIPG